MEIKKLNDGSTMTPEAFAHYVARNVKGQNSSIKAVHYDEKGRWLVRLDNVEVVTYTPWNNEMVIFDDRHGLFIKGIEKAWILDVNDPYNPERLDKTEFRVACNNGDQYRVVFRK